MSPWTDDDDALATDLQDLHGDELAYLGKERPPQSLPSTLQDSFPVQVLRILKQYFLFVWHTATKSTWNLFFFPTTMWDRISIIVMAVGATVIMTGFMVWCIFSHSPRFVTAFNNWSKKRTGGLSMINAGYPTIFKELSPDQIKEARRVLSQHIEEAPNKPHKRVFNLDVAKLLLQCSALMYERTSKGTMHAMATAASHRSHARHRTMSDWEDTSVPGQRLNEICGAEGALEVKAQLHECNAEENTIQELSAHLGLRFSTVSEMNSAGSAFCALFWDPDCTFVIVAFKGTGPSDFMEWSSDFTFQPVEAGQWIRSFGKVHGGFMDKVFPRRIPPGSRLPYDTVNEAIKKVTKRLLIGKPPGTKINLWTTGHSLGCAMASLTYARQINEVHEVGPDTVIRDAYLFAAPIVCDVESVNAFNNRMRHNAQYPRTMWRVTNGRDAVATMLPQRGDVPEWSLSPFNLFTFAHLGMKLISKFCFPAPEANQSLFLGCEIRLRSAPERSEVFGTLLTPGTHVVVESSTPHEVLQDSMTATREEMAKVQKWPIIGRLLAHAPGFYWTQISAISTGTCTWTDKLD
ncbi:alpha/beta-hydrolase [Rickenella mellea]|uniref:Alpha/beta-hydrolase n=1 Tax=Rickenella mellea TaxID=50990 RepID=A0A4Y7PNQ6_9AGAM|nr:alpha/beta-hydrolase [Rickenella mellea]